MPTNDERREVAARLRDIDKLTYLDCFLRKALGCADECRKLSCSECAKDACNRLADYVEPEPERTCQIEMIDTGNKAAYEHHEHIAHCHSCHHEFGYVLYNEDGDTWQDEKPNYCPNCGEPVKEGE